MCLDDDLRHLTIQDTSQAIAHLTSYRPIVPRQQRRKWISSGMERIGSNIPVCVTGF